MDAAIEFLIAERGMESLTENDSETASAADITSRKEASDSAMESNEEESSSCSNIETVLAKCSLQTDEKVHLLA